MRAYTSVSDVRFGASPSDQTFREHILSNATKIGSAEVGREEKNSVKIAGGVMEVIRQNYDIRNMRCQKMATRFVICLTPYL